MDFWNELDLLVQSYIREEKKVRGTNRLSLFETLTIWGIIQKLHDAIRQR
jgi:hypothetical protein